MRYALLALAAMLAQPLPLAAQGPLERVAHSIAVELDLSARRLSANDRLEIWGDPGAELVFHLRTEEPLTRVAVNGRSRSFTLRGRVLRVPVDGAWQSAGPNRVEIGYGARHDDPAPARPLNSDNPGYGVEGTIGDQGAFLLAGSGWYPRLESRRERFEITVRAPAGILAVTSGRSLGHASHGASTLSTWRIDEAVEGPSLAAGPFAVDTREAGGVTLATYFTGANADLSAAYLAASERLIADYSRLFGPYPFAGFAVVENFFPTGYGFPGFTLVGGRILRLPFMLGGSLAHEVVHNWWGNGVRVDPAEGNWCEGLTTYVADYRLAEAQGPREAAEHRLQILRGYASLVVEGADFPLDRFRSREDPVTQSVGYGKGAMVFHMLRRLIGEEPFWEGLRDLYRRKSFQPATWGDLRAAFERTSGRNLEAFFDGWIAHPGALRLELSHVARSNRGAGWSVSGRVRQEGIPRHFSLPVVLETSSGRRSTALILDRSSADFSLESPEEPLALHLDPEADLFRRLSPAEIPPTVNRLKASRALRLIHDGEPQPAARQAVEMLLEGLGIERHVWATDRTLDSGDFAGQDLLLVGWPRAPRLHPSLPPELAFEGGVPALAGERVDQPGDVLFAVLPHPSDPGRVAALLHWGDPDRAGEALRKITHYGRYSYLAFRDGHNRTKGTWTPGASPLSHRWSAARHP